MPRRGQDNRALSSSDDDDDYNNNTNNNATVSSSQRNPTASVTAVTVTSSSLRQLPVSAANPSSALDDDHHGTYDANDTYTTVNHPNVHAGGMTGTAGGGGGGGGESGDEPHTPDMHSEPASPLTFGQSVPLTPPATPLHVRRRHLPPQYGIRGNNGGSGTYYHHNASVNTWRGNALYQQQQSYGHHHHNNGQPQRSGSAGVSSSLSPSSIAHQSSHHRYDHHASYPSYGNNGNSPHGAAAGGSAGSAGGGMSGGVIIGGPLGTSAMMDHDDAIGAPRIPPTVAVPPSFSSQLTSSHGVAVPYAVRQSSSSSVLSSRDAFSRLSGSGQSISATASQATSPPSSMGPRRLSGHTFSSSSSQAGGMHSGSTNSGHASAFSRRAAASRSSGSLTSSAAVGTPPRGGYQAHAILHASSNNSNTRGYVTSSQYGRASSATAVPHRHHHNPHNNHNDDISAATNGAAASSSSNSSMRRVQSAIDFSGSSGAHRGRASAATTSAGEANTRAFEQQLHMTFVNQKLKEMQFEMSQMNRKIKEYEEDGQKWGLRYTRRFVIISNLMLAVAVFLMRLTSALRRRERLTGLLGRMLRVVYPIIVTDRDGKEAPLPLSALLLTGLIQGLASSSLFVLATSLHLLSRPSAWKRNSSAAISGGYSIWLAMTSSRSVRLIRDAAASGITAPSRGMPWLHAFNLTTNAAYLLARYYYLHGLLVFGDMRIQ